MTRRLEELLNLPPIEEATEPTVEEALEISEEAKTTLEKVDDAYDKINAALPMVRDLDATDKDLDDLSELAKDSFKDLMDLACNVEPRFSGPIIQSASTLLGHAITAKVAKADKKLKMIDLQLKKARLDQQAEKDPESKTINGQGVVMDRNALLKAILAESKKTDK
jgi:hypothetical protein